MVYEATFHNVSYIVKLYDIQNIDYEDSINREIINLKKLRHPNIVKLKYCIKDG